MNSADATPENDRIAAALRVLSHPVRLEILRLVSSEELPVGEVAERAGLGQAVTSQHLRVLRDGDLVTVRREGNRRLYRLDFAKAAQLRNYLDALWAPGLEALKRSAERRHRELRS
jgi:DNA-binding transcriptional ArsR family regulator